MVHLHILMVYMIYLLQTPQEKCVQDRVANLKRTLQISNTVSKTFVFTLILYYYYHSQYNGGTS